jgi:hypothetical protein
MPVRIYDIAKKLGIENKEVLVKAKELGITAAKVPSSSLDKITAEYLESHLRPAAPASAEPAPVPVAPEPVLIVSAPPPEVPVPAPPVELPPVEAIAEEPLAVAPPAGPAETPVEAIASVPDAPPAPPAPPPAPRIGELVGRIQLPVRPAPRVPDKGGGGLGKPPARGVTPAPRPSGASSWTD